MPSFGPIGNVIGASDETGSFNYAALYASNWGSASTGNTYNSLSAIYGYGYSSYISGVAGTSPFFADFVVSTGYSGVPAKLGGADITGNFAPGDAFASFPGYPAMPGFGDIGGAAIAGGALEGFTAFAGTLLDMWYDFAIDKLDLPTKGARAFAGVINQESQGQPWALNPASGAVGADQWLGPRLANMAEFIDNLGLPFESLGAQSLFLLDEFSRMAAGGGRWGRLLLDMYDPLNSQRQDASDFVLSFVRPGRGAETRNDINAGASFFPTGYSSHVHSSPLFGLVPLPNPEDY